MIDEKEDDDGGEGQTRHTKRLRERLRERVQDSVRRESQKHTDSFAIAYRNNVKDTLDRRGKRRRRRHRSEPSVKEGED